MRDAIRASSARVPRCSHPCRNPRTAATSRVRSRFGNRPINKRDSVLEGLAILDAGGNLGLLADVNTLQRDGVFVRFFGFEAEAAPLLPRRGGRASVAAICRRFSTG